MFFSQNDIIFSVLLDTEKGESKMESNLIHSKLKMKGKNVEWLANEMTAYGQPISASTIYKKLKGEVVFKASDIKSNQLYQMGDSSLKEQNFGRFPLRFSPDT